MNMNADENNFRELIKDKERFKIALKIAKICVFEVDLTQQLYTFFENSEDIFGVSGESILRDVRPFSQLSPQDYQQAASAYFSHPDDSDTIDIAFKKVLSGQSATYYARMKAGKTAYTWCKIDVTPILQNNIPVRMIGIITDVSDMKAKTDLLENEVKLDMFTGLYNKKHSEELIKEVLCKEPNQRHGFIIFDLDNFKNINDTYGHATGDEILISISENLKKIFSDTDIIGRFGGDEFIVLVKNVHDKSLFVSKLEKLLDNNDNSFTVTKSIGASIFPDDAKDFGELLEKADKALYKSKQYKNMFTLFSNL